MNVGMPLELYILAQKYKHLAYWKHILQYPKCFRLQSKSEPDDTDKVGNQTQETNVLLRGSFGNSLPQKIMTEFFIFTS